jgi:eukaryotic-like serine/threonine-protein kinase
MPLARGTRLGSHEIVALLGAGGMGEVYRARDTKLGRDVALKILPDVFGRDAERLARFEREAKTLASLNHPNIAQVYDAGQTAAAAYLVMELVEGEDLSAHIARGPMAPAEVLAIAKQIALALDAAHEQTVIHRDLKPANIKVRADGTVKVLDFGLAKALDGGPDDRALQANSPTLTNRATEAGVILGTAAYMAPEQAKGRAVDKRADIWAFGCVLHEMLTGQRAFEGESVAETLGLIFARDPHSLVASLPPTTPAALRSVIARCLVKDPRERLRDIGDARQLIDEAIAGRGETTAVGADAPRKPSAPWVGPARLLAVPTLVAIAAAAGWFARPTPFRSTLRLSMALPSGEQVTTVPAISADGRVVAYAAGRTPGSSQLYLRALDDFAARPVANSADALYPFFSADGRTIAFFSGGKLRRASVDGGAPIDIASAPAPYGGTFDADGRIVFVPGLNSGLWRVSADGGQPEQLSKPDGVAAGYAHVYPQRLPGTRELLFCFWGQTFYNAVFSLDTGKWREVTPPTKALTGCTITAPGYLVANDGGGNVAVAAWTPSMTSPVNVTTPAIERVYWALTNELSWLNVSDNGTAVYVPGNPEKRNLVWIDRQGRATAFPGEPAPYYQATLSSDGRRVVAGGMASQWILDVATGARRRVVSDARTLLGGWLPGNERIVLSSNKDGDWDLYTIAANGGDLTPLFKKPLTQHVMAVGTDGTVIYLERQPVTGGDLWKLAPDGTSSPVVVTPFNETGASISADGRYVAYSSDEAGRSDVFAIPISGKGERTMISLNGGMGPTWSRDGRELFYRAGDDLMSVAVNTTGALKLGERRKLADLSGYDAGQFHEFDVSPDGQRFLLIRTDPSSRPVRLDIIVNWLDELKANTAAR